jgi:hypothetical protein
MVQVSVENQMGPVGLRGLINVGLTRVGEDVVADVEIVQRRIVDADPDAPASAIVHGVVPETVPAVIPLRMLGVETHHVLIEIIVAGGHAALRRIESQPRPT